MKKILLFCLKMGESQYQVEDVTLSVLNSQKVFFYKCERTKTPANTYFLQNFFCLKKIKNWSFSRLSKACHKNITKVILWTSALFISF